MHWARMRSGRKGPVVVAVALCLLVGPRPAPAQFFDGPRPPGEVPTPPPAVNLAPPNPTSRDRVPPPTGPTLQSLPPAPAAPPSAPAQISPSIPAGQAALALSARFGHDMAGITGGLVWRIYGNKP